MFFSNYRPISVLSTLSKVFERIMYSRLSSFFRRFEILKGNQFGFREACSTSDAVLEFLNDTYSSLEEREHMVAVCLDLTKAFDTIDHRVLYRKLDHVGVRGLALDWFSSYLCDRQQRIHIGDVHSDISVLSAGVPQGSVLGPLLFILYVNDMSNVSNSVKFIHYADDTTLYLSGPVATHLVENLDLCLDELGDWLVSNKLILNVTKTQCVLFSNTLKGSDMPLISIRGSVIDWVDSIKFLGIRIDNQMNFKEHVTGVCTRMSRAVGVIRRLSYDVPDYVLITLYYSLIYPHMTYLSLIHI